MSLGGKPSTSGVETLDVTFSIGTYRDEATLEEIVRDAVLALEGRAVSFEVLIVDDGSDDRTGEIADRLAAEDTRVRVIHHPENQGFAATLRDLYHEAHGSIVATAPGDGQFPAADIVALLDRIEDADIVLGVRYRRQDPVLRKLLSAFYNSVARVLLGCEFRDLRSW